MKSLPRYQPRPDSPAGRARHGGQEGPKPSWLKIRVQSGPTYNRVRGLMRRMKLNTVCEEARCPNVFECWSAGTATFMILGDVCTRRCGFCAVKTGLPPAPPDPGEPDRLAASVAELGLRHVVVTSVDRDDLPDGGAGHFRKVIEAIHQRCPKTAVEVLTPDFKQDPEGSLDLVLGARPEVFSHNIETVPELYRVARPGSRFESSLELLRRASARKADFGGRTKTAMMLGLGETDAQVEAVLARLVEARVDVLALGQYLRPSPEQMAVARFVEPAEFERWRRRGLEMGFVHVEAGPLVRSSYHAHDHLPGSR
ncbi:MAG: lipoyl synthase [Acidobacteriota bacterium]|nr:lipoyl synthase [Acidobacteriota bacterium]MDQ7088987.1 lipoyl synthase [Acidobacteriota bacterium]